MELGLKSNFEWRYMTNRYLFDEYKKLFSSNNSIITNQYMINRLLSYSHEGFKIAINCNKFINKIPNELFLLICKKMIRTNKAPFVRYNRVLKDKNELLLRAICRFYNCNRFHAKQYVKIYEKMNIDIKSKFGIK